MTVQPPSGSDMLNWLDEVDKSIQKLTTYLDMIFTDIEKCPQETVDYLCETAGDYATYVLNYAKVKILNGLGVQKQAADKLKEDYETLVKAIDAIEEPTSDNIVGVVGSIIKVVKIIYNFVIKPYENAMKFVTELTTKIISISASLSKVASYRPPSVGNISFDKFKIDFEAFTIADVSEDGKLAYPDPPEIQPFPNPFSNLKKSSTVVSGGDSTSSDIA